MNDTHTTTNGTKCAPRPHKKSKQQRIEALEDGPAGPIGVLIDMKDKRVRELEDECKRLQMQVDRWEKNTSNWKAHCEGWKKTADEYGRRAYELQKELASAGERIVSAQCERDQMRTILERMGIDWRSKIYVGKSGAVPMAPLYEVLRSNGYQFLPPHPQNHVESNVTWPLREVKAQRVVIQHLLKALVELTA